MSLDERKKWTKERNLITGLLNNATSAGRLQRLHIEELLETKSEFSLALLKNDEKVYHLYASKSDSHESFCEQANKLFDLMEPAKDTGCTLVQIKCEFDIGLDTNGRPEVKLAKCAENFGSLYTAIRLSGQGFVFSLLVTIRSFIRASDMFSAEEKVATSLDARPTVIELCGELAIDTSKSTKMDEEFTNVTFYQDRMDHTRTAAPEPVQQSPMKKAKKEDKPTLPALSARKLRKWLGVNPSPVNGLDNLYQVGLLGLNALCVDSDEVLKEIKSGAHRDLMLDKVFTLINSKTPTEELPCRAFRKCVEICADLIRRKTAPTTEFCKWYDRERFWILQGHEEFMRSYEPINFYRSPKAWPGRFELDRKAMLRVHWCCDYLTKYEMRGFLTLMHHGDVETVVREFPEFGEFRDQLHHVNVALKNVTDSFAARRQKWVYDSKYLDISAALVYRGLTKHARIIFTVKPMVKTLYPEAAIAQMISDSDVSKLSSVVRLSNDRDKSAWAAAVDDVYSTRATASIASKQ